MNRLFLALILYSLCSLCLCGKSSSEEPCTSGPQAGQRCGPYAALISTGPQRGQSFCYICQTGDKPAVVVFAHTLTDPLGKLVVQLDKAVTDHKKADLHVWVTLHRNVAILLESLAAGQAHHARIGVAAANRLAPDLGSLTGFRALHRRQAI